METVILIAVVVALIGVGMLLIHRLNAQHEARITTHHYSAPLPRPPGQPEAPGGGPFAHERAKAYLPPTGKPPRRPPAK
ncbi:hypothetical protein [Streptomyces sp. NPDC005955]|uniref:hypothetical protein n=1 Tax=Streptomyces sp. NPDC005955 TaxID=3364738 RepID=UPI0036A25B33